MAWKALLKTEWNESLLNSYWWLFIISNNLTFFFFRARASGNGALQRGHALSPQAAACCCASACLCRDSVDQRLRFFFFLLFFMSCICARTCFMVNKQAFFPRHQSLSAADQIAGRSAETALWKMDLGISANFSQFGGLRLTFTYVSKRGMFIASDNTLLPSENGPTTIQVFEINPAECSLRPRVLLPAGAFGICS